MDNKMDAPVITSPVLRNPRWNRTRRVPSLPCEAPFFELLALLKVIDNSKPTPENDGHRYCFQPSYDLSEIARVFISVSTSSSDTYDIDITTIRLPSSDAVPPAVSKLQEYANHVLQRVQFFRDRLFECGVIKDSACFLGVDLFTCPLCRSPLISCFECDFKVACSSLVCPGSLVIDCELCRDHRRMSCRACLAKGDPITCVVCCPECQMWCCREDLQWCVGLVLHPAPGTEELAELSRKSDWDNETIVRSHPPKPGPCMYCTENPLAEGWTACYNTSEPDRCPSQTPRTVQLRINTAFCPECVPQTPGERCKCGFTWVCSYCIEGKNKTLSYPLLQVCPGCGGKYCNRTIQYTCEAPVDTCRGCKGATLCNDCEEEEELPDETPVDEDLPELVKFVIQCIFCEAWSCFDCYVDERTATCSLCKRWFCYGCVSDYEPDCRPVMERCSLCNSDVCFFCRADHRACPGDKMLSILPPR